MNFVKAHIIHNITRKSIHLCDSIFEEIAMIPYEKINAIYEKHHYDTKTLQTLCDFYIDVVDYQQPLKITRDNYFEIIDDPSYQDPEVFQHKYLNREDLWTFIDQILQKVTAQINHWFKAYDDSTKLFKAETKLDSSFISFLKYNDNSVIGDAKNDVIFTLTKGKSDNQPWFPYNFGDFFYLSPVISDSSDRKLHMNHQCEITMTALFDTWPDLVKIYNYDFINNRFLTDTTAGKNATKVLATSLLLRITNACKESQPEFYQGLTKITKNQLPEIVKIIGKATEKEQTIYQDVFKFNHNLAH